MSATVLVTGGTGNTGRRIAARLGELGLLARTASRNPEAAGPGEHVRFDWHDESTHAAALAGVTRMYLVAPALVEDPAPVMLPLIARALAAGVRRIVLLGSSAIADDAPGLGAVARAIRETAPEWAVLRPSWFMQNFTGDHVVAAGVRDGEIVTATGDGRVGFVDAADIAAVAARALTDPVPHNTDHLITGPEALSYADAAAIITEVTGRPVRHRSVSTEDMTERLAAWLPAEFAAILAGLDEDIRGGAEDRVSTTVEDVTGRPPRSLRQFLS
jgi:uncharacterized protein YbjT (DUF2867 family)